MMRRGVESFKKGIANFRKKIRKNTKPRKRNWKIQKKYFKWIGEERAEALFYKRQKLKSQKRKRKIKIKELNKKIAEFQKIDIPYYLR